MGEPPGDNKRVSFLAIANELNLEVGELPSDGGGCTPLAFGLKAGPEVGEPPGDNKHVPFSVIDNELGLGVGEPPGDGGGYTRVHPLGLRPRGRPKRRRAPRQWPNPPLTRLWAFYHSLFWLQLEKRQWCLSSH